MCCRSGHSPLRRWRGSAHWADQLLLVEDDRDGPADGRALPLVAGALVERDVEAVGAGLAGGEGAELEGRERRRGVEPRVAAHADLELVVVGRLEARADAVDVAGVARDLHVGRDGPGVGDVEGLVLDLARLQVGEVEVEVLRALVVAEVDRERRGADVDTTGVGRREVRADRRGQHDPRHHGSDSEAATEGGEDVLLDVLALGVHEGPLSVADATVWMGCVGTFREETFSRTWSRHKDNINLNLHICQYLFINTLFSLFLTQYYTPINKIDF